MSDPWRRSVEIRSPMAACDFTLQKAPCELQLPVRAEQGYMRCSEPGGKAGEKEIGGGESGACSCRSGYQTVGTWGTPAAGKLWPRVAGSGPQVPSKKCN